MFLISFLLPVSAHCAPTVSIATSNGGPHFETRWNGVVVVVLEGVKVPRTGRGSDEIRIC